MDRAWTVHGLSHAGYGQSHHPPLERRLQALTSSVRETVTPSASTARKREQQSIPNPQTARAEAHPPCSHKIQGGFPNPNEEEPAESSRATLTITRLGLGLLG
jgi:hypothetical protein